MNMTSLQQLTIIFCIDSEKIKHGFYILKPNWPLGQFSLYWEMSLEMSVRILSNEAPKGATFWGFNINAVLTPKWRPKITSGNDLQKVSFIVGGGVPKQYKSFSHFFTWKKDFFGIGANICTQQKIHCHVLRIFNLQ